ncbi:hypothetical protein OSTOST_05517 [Ostertagia ostertagi]
MFGVACDHPPILIVMEYCPGGDLQSHLKKQKSAIEVGERIVYTIEAARVCDTCTGKNCIHRDLAARNCLISAKVPQCFLRPAGKEKEADLAKAQFVNVHEDRLTLLNVYNAFKQSNKSEEWCNNNFIDYHVMKNAGIVRAQLEKTMERLNLSRTSTDANSENLDVNIRKALAAGGH